MFSLSVYQNSSSDRLDKYLSQVLWFSRNFVAKLLDSKYIYITKNQKKLFPKKSYIPSHKEDIYIDQIDRFADSGILSESPNIDIDILYQNHSITHKSDYLIIYKPKWVLSHPNSIRDVTNPSVSGRLYHNFGQLPNIGNFVRAWLVHRLDKDTDGLMIVVLTEIWLSHFQNLFQSKSTSNQKEQIPLRKFYKAKVQLSHEWKNFLSKINLPHTIELEINPKIPHYPKWIIAITKILWYDIDSLTANIDIEIMTGKTHQIRYHLAYYWLPIVGDYLYNHLFDSKWPQMQLTAYRLEWQDINWEYKILELESKYIS